MKNKVVLLIVLFSFLIGVFIFIQTLKKTQQPTVDQKLPIPTGHYDLDGATMMHENDPVEIKTSQNGFEPQEITIQVGDIVIFRNIDNTKHEIASLPHPQHTTHKELNIGIIEGIDTKSLILSKPGEYEYHDHLNPQHVGKIIVE